MLGFARTLLPAAALLLATPLLAEDFERTLPVSNTPDLYVSTGSGSIRIYPGHGSELRIRAHVHAGWNAGSDIQDRIRRIVQNPPIQVSGNSIRVGDPGPENRSLYNNISIDYEISAPQAVALNLRSGSGDLEIDNLGRFLKADTGSGSIRAHGLGGPADLHTGSGDIELEQRAEGEVRAATGSGSVRVHGLAGSLAARTGSGDIEADGDVTGPANLRSGSGSIRLHLGPSARYNVDAATGSGSIRVPGSRDSERHHVSTSVNGGGPNVQVQTGSGDIEIN